MRLCPGPVLFQGRGATHAEAIWDHVTLDSEELAHQVWGVTEASHKDGTGDWVEQRRIGCFQAAFVRLIDKGNATVLLDKADYEKKMLLLLQDSETYVRLKKDPTLKVEREFQKLLADVFLSVPPNHKALYYRLLSHNGSAPAFYGLPKIHKPDVPMRPIVDYTRSPLQNLSKFLHQVLAPFVGQGASHVQNSSSFVQKTGSITIKEDDLMVFFDVKPLFTSVPIDLAVNVCTAALESDATLPQRCLIDVPDLRRLLYFCLKNTYFVFMGNFYKQSQGTPKGTSVSVTAANLSMEALEQRALASFAPSPKVFLRYIDDCFCIIQKDEVSKFLDHLNSLERAIQFTLEVEVDRKLPFLDVLVSRQGQRLSFSVYRKDTHTGRYLSFGSVHPAAHKQAVVSTLLQRAECLCSRPEDVAVDKKKGSGWLARSRPGVLASWTLGVRA
ncbi:uncharacterized protein LOC144140884 [Haemaphysalis longicornis]